MNIKLLKKLIKEVITENRNGSVLLHEREIQISLDEVMAMLKDTNPRSSLQRFGILTAENPRGEASDGASNETRMTDLRGVLDNAGLDYVKLDGKYGGEETSYFILNMKKQDLIDLGKKYGQAAVIGGEKLIRNYREEQPSVYFRLTYYQTEPDGSEEPAFAPQEYYAIDDRDVVVANEIAQERTDFFSAIDGKKFFIPFFSDEPSEDLGDESGAYSAEKSFQPKG